MPKQSSTSGAKSAAGKLKDQAAGHQRAGEGHDLREMIATAAYYRAERSGFNGNEVEHWLEAEKELSTKPFQ